MKNLAKIMSEIKDVEFFENIDLKKYTTIKLQTFGSIAKVFTVEATQELIIKLNEIKCPYHLVGWGANQIIHDLKNTILIKLEFKFERNYLKNVHDEYVLPASISLNVLTAHAQKHGLSGWEVFTGIPASLGGAVFMNAGTSLGEIGTIVKEIKLLDTNGRVKTVKTTKDSFSYRENHIVDPGEVIIEVTLIHNGIDNKIKDQISEYIEFRKRTQPLTSKNCGCAFKNFDDIHKAGQFIDVCGLKGLTKNGLRVSHLHANFIENINSATSEDFIDLTNLIKYELELFSGIEFELEAKVY
jgi:UDP-N-acetylmuramate dehydrogenase